MAARTRSRVSSRTFSGALSTRETVIFDTPARSATSPMVTQPLPASVIRPSIRRQGIDDIDVIDEATGECYR
jgi:hypothetical protein